MKSNFKLSLMGIIFALALSACGKIPEAYQGNFIDAATGTKLSLEASAGQINTTEGRVIKSDANDLDFDSLVKGKPGIYVRTTTNSNKIEVFWLLPNVATKKQEAEFAWMEAEVFYTRMNIKANDKAQQIKMLHCTNGMILLDMPTKSWNGGCPAESQELDFRRTDK